MFRPRPPQTRQNASPSDADPTPTLQTSASDGSLPLGPDGSSPMSKPVAGNASAPKTFWQEMMADNPYFSAGAGLMGIGVVLTVMRRATSLGATFAQRRMLVTLEIPSKDRSYAWFLEWMAHHSPSQPAVAGANQAGPSRLGGGRLSDSFSSGRKGKGKEMGLDPTTAATVVAPSKGFSLRSHELAVETSYKQHENGASEAVFNLVPGPGTHYFKYGGSWFQVKRERDAKLMDLHSGTPWETLTLTTLSSSRHLFSKLLAEARTLAEASTEGKTVVYTAWGVEWRPFGKPRRRREMGSVVLQEGVAERIEHDLKGFLGRGKWYAERGIPYRRGYLLYGPPGSGKTSFIQALAGSLNYNICLLNLAERGLTDDKLNHLLGLVPERSFVLLEDVDSAFSRRVQTSEDGYKSSVTFSGLLNALDGVASSEERIIFMTTNHYDKLDPALIRPGRVDVHELLDDAAGEQAERLFRKFYGIAPGDDAGAGRIRQEGEEVLSAAEVDQMAGQARDIVDSERQQGRTVSMASLQGLFIRSAALEALGAIRPLCKEARGVKEQ